MGANGEQKKTRRWRDRLEDFSNLATWILSCGTSAASGNGHADGANGEVPPPAPVTVETGELEMLPEAVEPEIVSTEKIADANTDIEVVVVTHNHNNARSLPGE